MGEPVQPVESVTDQVKGEATTPASVVPALAYVDASTEAALRLRRQKRIWLIIAMIIGLGSGVVAASARQGTSGANVITGILFGVCGLMWIALDSQERGRRVSLPLKLATFLVVPLGIVLYYVELQDWPGLGRAVLYMVTLIGLSIGIEIVLELTGG